MFYAKGSLVAQMIKHVQQLFLTAKLYMILLVVLVVFVILIIAVDVLSGGWRACCHEISFHLDYLRDGGGHEYDIAEVEREGAKERGFLGLKE